MESTATKGVYIERLSKGYYLEIDTKNFEIKVFSPTSYLKTVAIGHDIYSVDVKNVRESVIENFNLNN